MGFMAGLFGAGRGAASGAALGGINAAGAATGTMFKPATLEQFQNANFGSAANSNFSVPKILQGGIIGLGAAGKIIGGIGENVRAKAEAGALDLSARASELAGRRDVLNEIIDLNTSLGSNVASRSASGNSLSGSTLATLVAEEERATANTNIITTNAQIEAGQKRLQAKLARRRGKFAFFQGLASGLTEFIPGKTLF